jgi:hypothetical protein
MKYKKPQLHLVGNASNLIQAKGNGAIDPNTIGRQRICFSSKLEEK